MFCTRWTLYGRFDAAYEFNGDISQPSNIFVPNNPTLEFDSNQNFTLSAWIKTNTTNQTIFLKNNSDDFYSMSISEDGKVNCSIGDGNIVFIESDPNTLPVTNDLWHHIVCTYDRSNLLYMYIDGTPVGSVDISSITSSIPGTLYIGTNTQNVFNGTIDEVAIFNKTLNLLEILEKTNYGRVIKNPITPNDYVPVAANKVYGNPDQDGPSVYNVSYGIKQPVPYFYPKGRINKNFNFLPPFYPYNSSLVKNPPISFNDSLSSQQDHGSLFAYYSSHFPSYPLLCNRFGPNSFEFQGAKYSCETYSIYNYSIQSMLREYIINQTKKCVNFDFFTRNYKYNITEGEITGDVLFGEDDVSIFLDYPITINVEGKPPTTKVKRFNKNIDIPFKKLHELASHIMGYRGANSLFPETESDNIFFNITNAPYDCRQNLTSHKISCIPLGLPTDIKIYHNYCDNYPSLECDELNEHYEFSHIMKIIPNKTLDGKEFPFLFAVENRIPVLDLIDETIVENATYSKYLLSNYSKFANTTYNKSNRSYNKHNFNIVVNVSEEIEIFPFGLDPDDENVIFNYSGWKTPFKIENETTKIKTNYKDKYLIGLANSDYVSGGFYYTSNSWEDSTYYTNNHKGAIYQTKLAYLDSVGTPVSDVGYHWVRVSVTDAEGLYDYQDIKIHVRCPEWHSCCDPTRDYHWKPSPVVLDYSCDISHGWPCIPNRCNAGSPSPDCCDPGY